MRASLLKCENTILPYTVAGDPSTTSHSWMRHDDAATKPAGSTACAERWQSVMRCKDRALSSLRWRACQTVQRTGLVVNRVPVDSAAMGRSAEKAGTPVAECNRPSLKY